MKSMKGMKFFSPLPFMSYLRFMVDDPGGGEKAGNGKGGRRESGNGNEPP